MEKRNKNARRGVAFWETPLHILCHFHEKMGKRTIIVSLAALFVIVICLDFQRLIQLPEAAHNVLGEMPIVEHFDDGDLGGKSGYSVPMYQGTRYENSSPTRTIYPESTKDSVPVIIINSIITPHHITFSGYNTVINQEGKNDMD